MTATRAARHRLPGRVVIGGSVAVVVAAVAMIAGLLATGGSEPDSLGLESPDAVVAWSAPAFRLLLDLAVIGCAGALLSVMFLLRTDGGPLGVQGGRAVRDAGRAAIVWSIAALGGAVVAAASVLGVPISLLPGRLGSALSVPEVQALLLSAVLAAVLAGTTGRIRTSSTAMTAGGLAVAAMLPPLLTTFPRNESGVQPATLGLVVYVFAATAWIGGLAGVVRYGRGSRAGLPLVLSRFGTIVGSPRSRS